MSSILKALKKLEHEKTGRLPDSLKIDSDILKATDASRGLSPYVLALLLLLVFGGGASVTYFFIKNSNAPQATTKPPQVAAAKSLQPVVPPPVGVLETFPAQIAVVPASKETVAQMQLTQQQKTALSGKVPNVIVKKTAQADETDNEAKNELSADAAVPVLRVNGIAFENSGAGSVAIVNGITVTSGSIVEGFTVEEVRKDRVLFQRNGEKLDIQLGQSNR